MPHLGPDVTLDEPIFIHDTALIHGKVHVCRDVTIWPRVVMRAEVHDIHIGARSNVQDFVMVHVAFGRGTWVGEDCSITHHATLHGCEIGDRSLVGINATVMDGAVIGANSVVAGHAIVTEGARFPDDAVIAGVPAKQVGERDSSGSNLMNAAFYRAIGRRYAAGIERLDEETLAELMAML